MSNKILLVEDEVSLAMSEAHTLEKGGYEVVTVYNGEKAVETVDSDPEINLVLMDIVLGEGIDGAEAAQKILERHNLPIVFLSSHTEQEVVDRTKGITSYGYVVKDSGETVMLTSIKTALELFEAKSEVHDLYENAPCGYHSLDREGVFVRINNTELSWLGYSRGEVVGKKKFSELITAESLETYKENFPAFKERGYVEDLEFEMVCRDGTTFPVLVNATAVKDSEGDYLMSRSVMIDISERKKAREQLKERVKELNCLYEISSVVEEADIDLENILQKTADIVSKSMQYPEIAACRITLDRKEYLSKEFKSSRQVHSCNLYVEGEEAGVLEVHYTEDAANNDEDPFLEEEKKLIDKVAERMGRIIERIQEKEALNRERTFLSAVLNTIEESIVICDEEGIITRFNEAARRLHRLPARPIPIDMSADYFHLYKIDGDTPLPTEENPLYRALKGEHVHNAEMCVKPENSPPRLLSCNGDQLIDENGKRLGAVVAQHEITERKRSERLKEEVNRITRHDVRSSLNGMLGIPQVLKDASNLTGTQKKYLQMIIDSGSTILNMINLSLTIYQIEEGTYEYSGGYFDLLKVYKQCIAENKSLIEGKNIEVAISTDGFEVENPEKINVFGEEVLAYSVFSNLLKNAVEASPPDSTIRIDITRNTHILFLVHNEGMVPKEIQNTFFDKYSTSAKEGGTGIGTYSAKILAEAQGWNIDMKSSEENGTKITVTIPIKDSSRIQA